MSEKCKMDIMRKQRKKNTLPESKDQRITELEEQLVQALATIQRLQKLQKEVERLQAEVEELKRAGKRQAAPFARRKLVEHPKKSGAKQALYSLEHMF